MRPGFDAFLEECGCSSLSIQVLDESHEDKHLPFARSAHNTCLGNHLQYFGNHISRETKYQSNHNARTTQFSNNHPEAQLVPLNDLILHRLELIHIPVHRNISTGEVLTLLLRQPDKKTST